MQHNRLVRAHALVLGNGQFKHTNGKAKKIMYCKLPRFSFTWLTKPFFHQLFFVHSTEEYHSYDTLNKDTFRLPLTKASNFQSAFKYNAAIFLNTLPCLLLNRI